MTTEALALLFAMLKPSIPHVTPRFAPRHPAVRPRDLLRHLVIPRNREMLMVGEVVSLPSSIYILLLDVVFVLSGAATTAAEAKGEEQEKEENDDPSYYSSNYSSDVGLLGSSDERLSSGECSSGAGRLGSGPSG